MWFYTGPVKEQLARIFKSNQNNSMIHICKSLNGQFYNRIVAKNGKIVATSELFLTKKSALKNIEAMKSIFGISANKAKTFIKDKTS